jgi:hypothetical protein
MRKTLVGATIGGLVALSADALADDTVARQQAVPQTQAPASTTTVTAATPPPSAAAEGALPPPPERQRESVTLYQKVRPNRAYLITGGSILVGSYVTTAVLTSTENEDRTLYIPVVGPWLSLADRPSDADTTATALIVASGVVQGAGALLTVAGFLIPEKIPAATIQAGNVKINLSPTSYGRGSAGIGAVGTF